MFIALFLLAFFAPFADVDPAEAERFERYRPMVERALAMANAHCDFIHAHQVWDAEWTREADHDRFCWLLLDDVLNPDAEESPAAALWLLRSELGPLDYYAARMPTPAPYHRFVDRERP